MSDQLGAAREGGERARSPVERLLRRSRPDRARRLTRRELRVEAVAATSFLLVAVAMPLLLSSGRAFVPMLALALVGSHVIAARIPLHLGAGCAVPTQLVLVPMLFLMPVATVPALVACSFAAGAALDVVLGRAHPERVVTAVADAWHVVGSSTVLALAGEPGPQPASWPMLGVALAAQMGMDLISAIVREWLGRGISPALQLRVIAAVHLIDLCLTPIGLLAALFSADWRFGFVIVVPLMPLLAAFASDRRERIEEIGARLDELRDERARLDVAIRRIGDAFGSRLDRSALADIALRTAVEALDAERGCVALTSGPIESGACGDELDALLGDAADAARRDGAQRAVADDAGRFATAYPLGPGHEPGSFDALAIARSGRGFSEDEHALLGHLAGQARVAMENVALHDQLRRQATVDELTGLSNHRRFQEILAAEVERSHRSQRPVALVMLDIDDFKAVNDSHGHQQGDVVLREVAAAIGRSSRVTDEPARYGGEELAVVLPETDLEGAAIAADKMRRAIEALELPLPDGSSLRVTVSAGVSALGPATGEPGSLMAAADAALYEAKRSGKNRIVRGGEPAGRFAPAASLSVRPA